MLKTMPHAVNSNVVTVVSHILAIPPCCPVSHNPRPGSSLTITYEPYDKVLEVASLYAYIHSFVDGLKDEDGVIVVRNMEEMIERIAVDCSQMVGVRVSVEAELVLLPQQRMHVEVSA